MSERQYLSQKTQIMRPIPIVVASRASAGDNRQSSAVSATNIHRKSR